MNISVVVPTFNRAKLLTRTLPALLHQNSEGFTYEIVYVINGSSDGTEELLRTAAEQFPERLKYRYLNPTGGPSAPRNVGIQMATGDVVVILDDDVLAEPNLLLEHFRYHREHLDRRSAALGYVYVPEELTDDPMSFFHAFPYHEVERHVVLPFFYFWTCNISFKRDFMLQAGMFDETFLYYEDMICGHQLVAAGMQLRFVPHARGQHLHQMRPVDLAQKGQFLGRWLVPFVDRIPETAVKIRFGLLSPEIGLALLGRRLLKRLLFRFIDNRLTLAVLRWLDADNGKRSTYSDAYYFVIFRRNLLSGYYKALREKRRGSSVHWKQSSSQYSEKGST